MVFTVYKQYIYNTVGALSPGLKLELKIDKDVVQGGNGW